MYFIDPNNISVLYGDETAPAPEPQPLYSEVAAVGEYQSSTKKWLPNCYLFDPKFYRDEQTAAFLPQTRSAAKEDIADGIKRVKDGLSPPRVKLGIVALNDCARFAIALMRIMADGGRVGLIDRPYNLSCAEAAESPAPSIADTFLLNYGGCYHGITVVAREGSGDGFITLEAHASKLRKKPDFHAYTGMSDFIAKNFPVERQATGQVHFVPNNAGAGIIPAQGLAIKEMKSACTHLERMVQVKDAHTIFTLLQAPENPSRTTYLPALYTK
jgi:hypothetical protein